MSKFILHASQIRSRKLKHFWLLPLLSNTYTLQFKEIKILEEKEAISFFLINEAKHIWEKNSDVPLIRKLFRLPAWHLYIELST